MSHFMSQHELLKLSTTLTCMLPYLQELQVKIGVQVVYSLCLQAIAPVVSRGMLFWYQLPCFAGRNGSNQVD